MIHTIKQGNLHLTWVIKRSKQNRKKLNTSRVRLFNRGDGTKPCRAASGVRNVGFIMLEPKRKKQTNKKKKKGIESVTKFGGGHPGLVERQNHFWVKCQFGGEVLHPTGHHACTECDVCSVPWFSEPYLGFGLGGVSKSLYPQRKSQDVRKAGLGSQWPSAVVS